MLDPATGDELATVPLHAESIVDLALADRTVVTASGDGRVRWFDLDGGARWAELVPMLGAAEGPATSDGEGWLALGEAALLRGDPASALARFERAEAAGARIPPRSGASAAWGAGDSVRTLRFLADGIPGACPETVELWRFAAR